MKRRDKRLLKEIGEFLKGDSYMYGPLFALRQVTARGCAKYIKRVTMEVSTSKLTRKNIESTVESPNITVEDQFSEDDVPEIGVAGDRAKLLCRETLKHVVYQTCRSSSVSGKGVPDSRMRKLLID
uniref:Uncharacterized protein LOC8277240 isoform X1 n=2 Tax=Rhizophora mucronata TaxID=61149 RepID=A0A2P2JPP4_RHIMU